MGKIIIPRKKIITLQAREAGRYRLQTRRVDNGRISKDTGWFNNLILDQGLRNRMNSNKDGFQISYLYSKCAVGTGNAVPIATNTSLQNRVATFDAGQNGGATAYVAASGGDPPYWSMTFTYTFPAGAAAGNITEVGVTSYMNDPDLYLSTRSLVKDSDGNPTSVEVLSDEILIVTFQIRNYLDTADHAFTFNLNGSPVTGTYRAALITSPLNFAAATNGISPYMGFYTGDIGDINSRPSGTSLGSIDLNHSPFGRTQVVDDIANSGTCYADWLSTVPISRINGTIKSFMFQTSLWSVQFGNLSMPIVKTNTQQMQVGIRTAWGRYTP